MIKAANRYSFQPLSQAGEDDAEMAPRLENTSDTTIALISEVCSVANKFAARKMFDKGVAAYVKKDFKTSVGLFSRAIIYDPTLALFYVSRGAASLKLGRAREAIDDFDRAINIDRHYARAYHLRGLAYEKLGEFARAFQNFDRSLEIDPEYSAAYHSRESMLSNPQQSNLAFEDFEMVNHLMAMRLTHFDKKVLSDLAI
jgi:tetratricopeptide (TPR) repeat protein